MFLTKKFTLKDGKGHKITKITDLFDVDVRPGNYILKVGNQKRNIFVNQDLKITIELDEIEGIALLVTMSVLQSLVTGGIALHVGRRIHDQRMNDV